MLPQFNAVESFFQAANVDDFAGKLLPVFYAHSHVDFSIRTTPQQPIRDYVSVFEPLYFMFFFLSLVLSIGCYEPYGHPGVAN
ncbi:hypothetical protein I7I53_03639 [Histoplasma capsulatum var. duboisii H88]|uniref:Uncharacterized protein n=1 Tax=Ajellomyces capsulatus (strain H88) TaxID=544711 RepID=A0A8A1LNY2_AJEC8|nr:hypothetical protein I7I53_03639 [Histoplasma capsulatum var. duboisii H88]